MCVGSRLRGCLRACLYVYICGRACACARARERLCVCVWGGGGGGREGPDCDDVLQCTDVFLTGRLRSFYFCY